MPTEIALTEEQAIAAAKAFLGDSPHAFGSFRATAEQDFWVVRAEVADRAPVDILVDVFDGTSFRLGSSRVIDVDLRKPKT